jgi:TolA-binding protein
MKKNTQPYSFRGGIVFVAATLFLLLATVPAVAQDAVFKFAIGEGRKARRVTGKITKVDPSGVTIGKEKVPASEIRRISLDDEPNSLARIHDQMNAGQFASALEAVEKITDAPARPLMQQELSFIRAYASARISLTSGEITAKDAGSQIKSFLTKYPDSFHTYPAIEQYGLLIYSFGNLEAAANEFAKLQKADWLEYKLKGYFWRGRMMSLLGNGDAAAKDFAAILAESGTDDLTKQYQKLAACLKARELGVGGDPEGGLAVLNQIREKEGHANSQLFAYTYNSLGVIHEKQGNLKQASVDFLHTPLLFGVEADAHAEALYRLSQLWPQLSKPGRANEAREELQARFRNSYWARKL